jgi:hypothetical protein
MRTLSALTGYFYAVRGDEFYVNLYAQSDADLKVGGKKVKISQATDYPWNGAIKLKISPEAPARFTLNLRLPGWAEGHPVPSNLYEYDHAEPAAWSLRVNGEKVAASRKQGYATITREWKAGDAVDLELPMIVRRVKGNDKVAATRGRVALERGPVVYCLEGVDNGGSVSGCVLPANADIKPAFKADMLDGATILTIADGQRLESHPDETVTLRKAPLVAIPYALWNNRGLSPMEVWIARDANVARDKGK